MAITQRSDGEGVVDPMLAGFDYLVALAGYVLLFISVLLVVPALAAFALALAHREDAHPLVRGHFRFQLRIFYTALLFAALAMGSILGVIGLGVTGLVHLFGDQLRGASPAVPLDHLHTLWAGVAAALAGAAVLFLLLAAGWLIGASVFGLARLVRGRPIGRGTP